MEFEGKQIRVAIVGGGGGGKSCIVKRFVENGFQGNPYNPTMGVDFYSRRITVRPHGTATLIILDIGGLAIESKMLGIYFNSGVDILLLTYDVTNMSSLNELRKWIQIIQLNQLDLTKVVIGLVGSKADLEHLRTVRLDNHTRFKQEFEIPLSFIVSAKSGENILTCFTTAAMYYVNPDGRNRIRDPHGFGLGQSLLPKVPTLEPSEHLPAGPIPISASTAAAIRRDGLHNQSISGAGQGQLNDLNSVVCSVQ